MGFSGQGLNLSSSGQRNQNNRRNREETPNVQVEETFEGCTPRIDEVQGKVVLQSRTLTKTNGQVTKDTGCQDTLISYPIRKSYTCPDLIDHASRVAHPQYSTYWINGQGQTQEIRACAPNVEVRFDLVEDGKVCQPLINLEALRATLQSELIYVNRDNKRVQVEACRSTPGIESVPIHWTAHHCTPTHDLTHHHSVIQKRAIFNVGDTEHIAAPCQDSDEVVNHERNRKICKPLIDHSLKHAIPQFKWEVKIGEEIITLSDCQPLEEAKQALQAAPCENKFVPDILGGKSYGTHKWYHTLKGQPKYLTGCIQNDSVVYLHSEKIEGYDHDEATRTSQPQTSLWIRVNDRLVLVDGAYARPNSPRIPWILDKTEEIPVTDQAYFEGCHQITPTQKVASYRRPDQSLFGLVLGDGTLKKSRDLCVRENETKKDYIKSVVQGENHYCVARNKNRGFGFSLFGFEADIHKKPLQFETTQGPFAVGDNMRNKFPHIFPAEPIGTFRGGENWNIPRIVTDYFTIYSRIKTKFPDPLVAPHYSPWKKLRSEERKFTIVLPANAGIKTDYPLLLF